MSKLLFIVALVLCSLSLNSCAAIFSGTKDKFTIHTTPPNADVYFDNVFLGKSGTEIIVDRKFKNQREILLKLEGYEDAKITVDQKIATAYWFNIPLTFFAVVPGMVGFGVDIGTGSALKPEQTVFNCVFNPIKK